MSKEEYLKELLKWVSSDSLLVVDKTGKLRRIYCPFCIVCLVDFSDISLREKISVHAIKLTEEINEVFISILKC